MGIGARVVRIGGFWLVTAALLIGSDRYLGVRCAVALPVKAAIIVVIAGAYMKSAGTDATLDHALFVGTIWLALSIVVEVTVSIHDRRSWFELIGSPASAWRNLVMLAWAVAPVLFAHRRAAE